MKRKKSIRDKRDPQKPCHVAFRGGLEDKHQGLPQDACPYASDDSYTKYLLAYWLNGYSSQTVSIITRPSSRHDDAR
jgi:hypothetical protein